MKCQALFLGKIRKQNNNKISAEVFLLSMLSRVHGPTGRQAFSVHRREMLVFVEQALTCYLALFFFIQYTYIFYHWLEGVYYHFIGASHQAKRCVGAK